MEKISYWITLAILLPAMVAPEVYFDINSYIRFNQGKNVLKGAEKRITFRFRYCNNKGVILYQSGPDGYFAIGVNSNKIYIEWKTSNIVVELYIGNGNLQRNVSNTIVIDNLSNRASTIAYVNGALERVEYLIILDEKLNFDKLSGEVFVGGFVDVSLLPMNTERLSAYLTTCVDYIQTAIVTINLTNHDFSVGVYQSCPEDFCAPPSIITTTSTSSFVHFDFTIKSRTQTQISFKFRTKDSQGMLFYIGGPAYLTLFLINGGRLGIGLNTRGTEPGAYNYSALGGFNDGSWKYVQVTRSNNEANVTNDVGYLLASTKFGASDESGYNMNAESLYMAGLENRLNYLPNEAQTSTSGCFEAPRFVSYSIASEPASLLTYDTQIKNSRDIKTDGCFNTQTCINNPCISPSQVCNFRCECAPGFYTFQQTPLSCVNVNDCASTPCVNNGTCVDLILDYRCECRPRYRGKDCSLLDSCFSIPCQNAGVCIGNDNGFTCNCANGFTGSTCQTDLDECLSSPCLNGATCNNLAGRYECMCFRGYTGTVCGDDVDECVNIPCLNGGRCVNVVGSFRCDCVNGWTGSTCQQDIDECASSPCVNGATCFNDIGFYRCFCLAGFSGVTCSENIDECLSNPCRNGGTCNDARNAYNCLCLQGYTGNNCEVDIDECTSQPCRNGGICLNEVNRFSCRCNTGYTGVLCESDIDECVSNPCLNGGTCQNNVGFFRCFCAPGYFGTRCEGSVNLCQPDPCRNGATCINGVTSFNCACLAGWSGTTCEVNINDCNSSPCLNGGLCDDLINAFRCRCASGYDGVTCANDIDECTQTNTNPCLNGGTCSNLVGRFSCQCTSGWNGNRCENNIDECSSNPCSNAVCVDRVNAYECQCNPGFEGTNCRFNRDECISNPCQNSGNCIDQINSYACDCRSGFGGTNCEININECLSSPCRNNGVCDDLVGGFRCICASGFEGTLCELNINDCFNNQCANGATCIDLINQFRCDCVPGWSGQMCEQNINECASNPCVNNAICEDLLNSYKCNCPPGFQGPSCSQDIDECNPSVCVNAVSCVNTFGSYQCQCSTGFTGKNCDSSLNACLSQPCHNSGTCSNQVNGGFTCQCSTNFMGSRCEAIIRFCNFTTPCAEHAICNDVETGGYECLCKPGYTGVNCLVEVNECNSNPCFNGGTCFDLLNQYRCLCRAGYTGSNCRIDIDECASNPCMNEGRCTQPNINGYQCECKPGYEGVNCERVRDNCQGGACNQNQLCTNGLNTFTCSCIEGFTGGQCIERSNKCFSQPCKNGGVCTSLPDASFSCSCPPPFSGSICDVSDDACAHNPCLHLGLCIRDSTSSGGLRCQCRPGFIGSRCQGDVVECLSNPCQNGGTCDEIEGSESGYVCRCRAGFEGTNCQTTSVILPPTNPCSSFPCLNQGTCFPITNLDFRCVCLNGWTGKRCGTNVNECLPVNPCQNNGVCQDNTGSYVCTCVNGWTGFNCDIPPADPCSFNPCPGEICQAAEGGTFVCCPLGSAFCPNPCLTRGCLNGATCTATSTTTFVCQCAPGTQGDRCQIVMMATFEGNNYVQIPYSTQFSSSSSSSLTSNRREKRQSIMKMTAVKSMEVIFATNLHNCLIMFVTASVLNDRREYMMFEIYQSKLRIAIGFSNKTVINTFDISQNLLNKNFTKIQVRIASNSLFTSITPCHPNLQENSNNPPSNNYQCNYQTTISWDSLELGGQMFFGSVPVWTNFIRSKVKSSQNYAGCLGGLKINQESISIIPPSKSRSSLFTPLININATENPIAGCIVLPNCRSDYCENGGRCVDWWSFKTCVCTSSYAGKLCERQQVIHLSGSSTFGYQRSNAEPFKAIKVVFEVTSNISNGFILNSLSPTKLAVFLNDWFLTFVLWSPNNIIRQNQTTVSLQKRQWFRVTLDIKASSVRFLVTSTESNEVLFEDEMGNEGIIDAGKMIFIGSLFQNNTSNIWRNHFPKIKASIIGCVRSLKIDGVVLDLGKDNKIEFNNSILEEITKNCPREEGCVEKACSDQGICVSSWTGGQCKCYPGHFGPNCSEVSLAKFNGYSSFTTVILDTRMYSFGNHLSFHLKTRQLTESCVMFVQLVTSTSNFQSSYLCILISSGHLGLKLGSTNTMMTTFNVSTGDWSAVKIDFFDDNVNISNGNNDTDYQSKRFKLSTSIFNNNNDSNVNVLFGAGLNSNGDVDRFFKGCLRNVHLNDIRGPVSLDKNFMRLEEGIVSVKTQGDVKGDCLGDDVCNSNPCSPSGNCIAFWNRYECNCRAGWVGKNCDQVSKTCKSHRCLNLADCVNEADGYRCKCKAGYKGIYCEEVSHACDSTPCQNEGSCEKTDDGGFRCMCLNGFVGRLCEEDVNECASSPCHNGSSCINNKGNYTCKCPSWLSGTTCNTTQFCKSQPCSNNATCSEKSESNFKCDCQEGYSGERCQTFNPCYSSPCKNNGSCSKVEDGFKCSCAKPFYGETCESVDHCEPNYCQNGANCSNVKIGENSFFRCTCADGFYGRVCDQENSCFRLECLRSKNCPNVSSSYNCPCTLLNNSFPCLTLPSSCEQQFTYCQNDSKCQWNETSLTPYCKCLSGINCNLSTANACANDPCKHGSKCTPNSNNKGYTCNCTGTNYTGDTCHEKLTSENLCKPSPCHNNETCSISNSSKNYSCTPKAIVTNEVVTNSEPSNTGLILGLAIGLPLIILALLALYWLYHREQRFRGSYKPSETFSYYSNQSTTNLYKPPFTISNRNNNILT